MYVCRKILEMSSKCVFFLVISAQQSRFIDTARACDTAIRLNESLLIFCLLLFCFVLLNYGKVVPTEISYKARQYPFIISSLKFHLRNIIVLVFVFVFFCFSSALSNVIPNRGFCLRCPGHHDLLKRHENAMLWIAAETNWNQINENIAKFFKRLIWINYQSKNFRPSNDPLQSPLLFGNWRPTYVSCSLSVPDVSLFETNGPTYFTRPITTRPFLAITLAKCPGFKHFDDFGRNGCFDGLKSDNSIES